MPDTLIEYEDSSQSGKTLYAAIRDSAGHWWNGTASEAYNATDFATYAVALAEEGASGYFTAATPALPAGRYTVGIRQKAGASAAPSDTTLGGFSAYWDGSGWHATDGYFDGTRQPAVRNQDAVTAPTYDDCFVGAWSEAFGRETESDTAGTYVKTRPDGSGPVRSFTLTMDADDNPVGRS